MFIKFHVSHIYLLLSVRLTTSTHVLFYCQSGLFCSENEKRIKYSTGIYIWVHFSSHFYSNMYSILIYLLICKENQKGKIVSCTGDIRTNQEQ